MGEGSRRLGFPTPSIIRAPNSAKTADFCGLITLGWAPLGQGWPEQHIQPGRSCVQSAHGLCGRLRRGCIRGCPRRVQMCRDEGQMSFIYPLCPPHSLGPL